MNPETMFALARISELKRELSHPMLQHRYVVNQGRIAARRARRRAAINHVGRAIRLVVPGVRTGRAVAST
jgi:predicted Zn-dependent protease